MRERTASAGSTTKGNLQLEVSRYIDLGDLDLDLEQLCKDVEELPADLCTLPCCPETAGVCRSLFLLNLKYKHTVT